MDLPPRKPEEDEAAWPVPLLKARTVRTSTIQTICEEGLLQRGLVRRLHTLFPQHSGLAPTTPPLFRDKSNYTGIKGFRQVCATLAEHGIDIGFLAERELFIDVYRFLATRHTLNSIDWTNFATDSIFQLTFPQPGMIEGDVVEAYAAAESRSERRRIAAEHMATTNPHDGNQLINKPWFVNDSGQLEVLAGSQHKYPPVQLLFDQSTQHCYSFCTYCFRHAQVRGDDDMFLQKDVDQLHAYLRIHTEVNDVLITGGDAGFMPASRFEQYVTPLIEDPSLIHVKTVRLGTRALTFQPESILDAKYEPMLALFDRLYAEGIQVAFMAHFSTPREVLNPLTLAAIRRLQAHHVVLRSQSPMMRHISMFDNADGTIDIDRSAKNWIDLGNILGMLCIGFHSIYCARPTGEHHYFSAPLADVHKVYDQIYRSLPSINRPSRHVSMTTSAGKISIMGTTIVDGEKLFALKFSEGRNMGWLDQVFLAKYDEHTNNVALLTPHDTEKFFFADELAEIEAQMADALAKAQGVAPSASAAPT
jgi:lysine 2,3-aminomutase